MPCIAEEHSRGPGLNNLEIYITESGTYRGYYKELFGAYKNLIIYMMRTLLGGRGTPCLILLRKPPRVDAFMYY